MKNAGPPILSLPPITSLVEAAIRLSARANGTEGARQYITFSPAGPAGFEPAASGSGSPTCAMSGEKSLDLRGFLGQEFSGFGPNLVYKIINKIIYANRKIIYANRKQSNE